MAEITYKKSQGTMVHILLTPQVSEDGFPLTFRLSLTFKDLPHK